MSFAKFISKRLITDRHLGGAISRPMLQVSVAAVALGTVIMLIAIATGMGLQKKIKDKVIGFNGHIQLVNFNGNMSYEQLPFFTDSLQHLSIPNLAHLQFTAQKAGILKTPNDFEGVVLKGVDKHFDVNRWGADLLEGKLPSFGPGYQDSVVISSLLKARLNLHLGDKITLYFMRANKPPLLRYFFVGGIYSTGLEEFDKTHIIGDIHHVQRLYRWDSTQIGTAEIYLSNPENLSYQASVVRTQLPLDLDARTVEEQHEQLFQWLALFDVNIYVILLIMVAVASVNMITSLFILILERTPMIGILKALGSSNTQLRTVFIYQASYLVMRGLVWGNLIGLAFCLGQWKFGWIKLDPETYYVSEVPIHLPLFAWLGLNGATAVVCIMALVIPSVLVSKVKPVKAIRFE